ncbi:MAG TPA: TetR/AcrR family transcriptional regulator C-terminal domain-containing protein [Mycobacterium sp.]|nr:TetR/AcrR family transcriptional regulator C-terminal domain-containing protein [Mycobacterium sp.]
MQLHRRDVVAAATAILDRYGIADLTMRRLARELDITPGALYWHFASKQELLGAVADQLLKGVCAAGHTAANRDWRDRIAAICTRMRAALMSHTDGAELVSASFAAGQSHGVADILGALADTASQAGLDVERAALAARTLVYFVLGATADEQSRLQWADGPAGSPRRESADPAAGFEFGLRLLIDGLHAQSAADRMLDTLVAVPPA